MMLNVGAGLSMGPDFKCKKASKAGNLAVVMGSVYIAILVSMLETMTVKKGPSGMK